MDFVIEDKKLDDINRNVIIEAKKDIKLRLGSFQECRLKQQIQSDLNIYFNMRISLDKDKREVIELVSNDFLKSSFIIIDEKNNDKYKVIFDDEKLICKQLSGV